MNRELRREVVAREPVLIEPLTSRLAPSGNELCAIGVVVRGLIEWADGWRDAHDDRLRKMLEIAQELSSAHHVIACMARPHGRFGMVFVAHANPHGKTITRVAPSRTATEIGVLAETAPSTRCRP